MFKIGDYVTDIKSNGTGEGVIWRVEKIKDRRMKIVPYLCMTVKSCLRGKWVSSYKVDDIDLIVLGSVYTQLANIMLDAVTRRCDVSADASAGANISQ